MKKRIINLLCALQFFFVPQILLAQPYDQESTENTSMKMEAPDALESVPADSSLSSVDQPEIPSQEMDNAAPQEPSANEEKSASPNVSVGKKIIKAIEVEGNKTIGISTVLARIKIRVGEEYIQNVITDDIKRLYNTGYFSDVSVDRKDYNGGFKVIIYLTEKPIVEKVTFSKTRYINARALANKIKTKEGKFLDKKTLKEDIDTIKDLYNKKGLTTATVDTETFVDEVTNKVSLHFVIEEGHRVQIKKLNILGNRSYSDKKIIRTIKSRPDSLFTSGYLKEEILKEDMERIISFYEQNGFIDAKADYKLDYLTKGNLIVNISIEEGQRYFVGDIIVKGNSVLSEYQILDAMESIKSGNVFSREKLDKDIADVRTKYFDKGYIFADIKESTSLNPETGKVQVSLDVNEGDLAYVEEVKVQGNTRTRDIVIRREIRLTPGDQFDGAKLRRSKDRLKNLGYFEDVSYDIEDTDTPDRKNLIVQVKEAKTGSFSFGGGYSTIDQVVGFVELEQKNFDFTNWPTFTGGGQNVSLRAETGSLRNNERLSFTEPWLFDYPISGGFDAYRLERDRERDVGYAYDEKRVGGDLRLGKELSEYLSAGVTYTFENITIGNIESGVSADLAREEGKNSVSTLGFSLTRDTRDNVFTSTKGLFLNGSFDIAGGALGGDKDFYRLQTKTSYDIPLKFNSVLEFGLRTGFSDSYGDSDAVPIFERFFAGGARTIRGYDERKVGPIDPVTEDPIGGESLLVGNIEYTIPLVDFLKLATFFDTGNVWAKTSDFGSGGFKSGTGVGLRVKTPIGPINLDYGYPLNDEPGEEERSGKFYFSVSRGF